MCSRSWSNVSRPSSWMKRMGSRIRNLILSSSSIDRLIKWRLFVPRSRMKPWLMSSSRSSRIVSHWTQSVSRKVLFLKTRRRWWNWPSTLITSLNPSRASTSRKWSSTWRRGGHKISQSCNPGTRSGPWSRWLITWRRSNSFRRSITIS